MYDFHTISQMYYIDRSNIITYNIHNFSFC